MDKLARKLREDAATIDAEISAQLDSRIQASLIAMEPESAQRLQPSRRRRPVSFWLASSLTGVAAAVAGRQHFMRTLSAGVKQALPNGSLALAMNLTAGGEKAGCSQQLRPDPEPSESNG